MRRNNAMRHTSEFLRLAVAAALLTTGGLGGCSQYKDPRVPEPIRPFIEPEHGGKYLMYRPSGYDRRLAWPVVVVCHGGFPDSANAQIRAWTELAEANGFLVLAPELHSSGTAVGRDAAGQLALIHGDERHILAALHHLRAGHHLSEDRVFLYGWADGAPAALHTGLRNPHVFRAIAVAQPKFHEGWLADADEPIDHHQPLLVHYAVTDFLQDHAGSKLSDWLRRHGARVQESSAGPVRRTDCRGIVDWIEDVLRREPWAVIRVLPAAADPREVRFRLQVSHAPSRYRWSFGDGDESTVAEPVHTYAAPGAYRVVVDVEDAHGQEHRRTLDLTVN